MAGRLRLAATGVQDEWLTGEPQFSYFLSNFRRHSKFAFDYIESQFDGDIDFDKTVICTIPGDKGDLVKNMTLKVTLSDPKPDDGDENDMVWAASIITHMIDYAELIIGGQPIERITGEYIYMHQQLHNTNDDIEQTLYFLNGHGNYLSYAEPYTYFLDLPFYFYRNPTLAIPTCALSKQVIEVRIKIKPIIDLVRNISSIDPNDTFADAAASINKFSLDTEFVYVADIERDFLMSRPLDYVITQVQMSKFVMKPGETKRSVMLNFQHPVKELLFVSQNELAYLANVPNYYNSIVNAELRFNNEVVFSRDGLFLEYEQAFKHHVNTPSSLVRTTQTFNGTLPILGPSKFGTYSFALYPESPHPTGQVNMSRISHKMFTIEITPINSVYENVTRIYAINYNILRIESGLAGLKF
jgi:hypothetical protein|tara:strand:+ start:89 stop:1327 length:1239 start_codon:yes stop_codon:yes gene_type:complete